MRTVLACLLVGAVVGSGPAPARAESEPVAPFRIMGSTTVARVLERWSDDLATLDPPLVIELKSSGSSSAPHALLTDRADVVSMSRPMKPIELSAFRQHDEAEPVAVAVATDAIAIFVHESNPLEGVTLAQLDRVFARDPGCSDEPPIRTWGELGVAGPFSDRAISRFGRPAGSGTRAVFERIALCGARTDPKVRQRPGPRSVALSVAESRFGISYGSSSDAVAGVRMLAVSEAQGKPFVELVAETVREGAYPLSRKLWLYARAGQRDPRWRRLVEYALSERGQSAVETEGFWRLSDRRREEGLATVGR